MAIKLLVTDGNLIPVGDQISGWTSVVATPSFNTVGTGTVTMPATAAIREQLGIDRARLVVYRDDRYFMGGPIVQGGFDWTQQSGSGGSGDQSEPGLLTVNFADDFAWIANEVVYPDVAHAATGQTTANYVLTATNAEVVLRDLVNLNVGPGAIAARRVPQLVLGGLASVGTSINFTGRFDPLGDALRRAAIAGGGLGFRTVQSTAGIEFVVYQPSDLTASIRFSRGLSNLQMLKYAPQAPTCTVAIVGGDGTGSSRTIRERVNSSAVTRYGRIVKWINQGSTADTTVMDQAGDQALADGAESAQVTFSAIDTDVNQYGVNYALGDQVTVEVWPGFDISAVVRAVTLTADPTTGEVLTPLIGTDAAIKDSRILRELRSLGARIDPLERS
jgi:hypothetical protein